MGSRDEGRYFFLKKKITFISNNYAFLFKYFWKKTRDKRKKMDVWYIAGVAAKKGKKVGSDSEEHEGTDSGEEEKKKQRAQQEKPEKKIEVKEEKEATKDSMEIVQDPSTRNKIELGQVRWLEEKEKGRSKKQIIHSTYFGQAVEAQGEDQLQQKLEIVSRNHCMYLYLFTICIIAKPGSQCGRCSNQGSRKRHSWQCGFCMFSGGYSVLGIWITISRYDS